MRMRQRRDEEEMRLQQKLQKLHLETEIAAAQAEETVFADAERELQTEHPSLGSRASGVRSLRGRQKMDDEHPPNEQRSLLNPMAGEWQPEQRSHQPVLSAEHNNDEIIQVLQQGQQQQRQLLSAIQIPKVELISFDGDPLKYWGFIRSFENSVEKDTVDSSARLTRLIQYCTGKARSVVQCCAVMEPSEGYARARELLAVRFGNSYVITESWIDKVTEGPCIKPSDGGRLQDFADELQSCRETLKAMGHSVEVNSQKTLVRIIGRLPFFLQGRWKAEVRRIRKHQVRNPNIDDVTEFVSEAAEEANDPVYGRIIDVGKRDDRNKEPRKQTRRGASYSASTEGVYSKETPPAYSRSERLRETCPLCSGSHSLFGCDDFKGMKLPDRRKLANDKKLCYNCLRPGHFTGRCGLRRTCSVPGCGKRHTKFLHQDEQERAGAQAEESNEPIQVRPAEADHRASCSLTGAGGSQRVALPILPVVVRAPGSQRCVHTYALLDSGSTNTFCSEDLVREFQLKGEKTILSLTTLDKTNSQTHAMVVSLEVSDMANKNVTKLPVVYVRPTLPVHMRNMGRLEDTSRWTHLKDVDIPQVDTQKVTLLIGQDNPDVLIPVAIKKGKPGDPYATKTLLGWSLNGPLGGTRQHAATTNFVQADQDLSAQLEKFWKIEGCESLAEDRKGLSYEDKQAVAIWEETIRHHVDKHYEVAIPFRSCPPSLPHNQVMAEQRLESLRRRLIRDTNLHMSYTGFMEELIDKGYAEKVVEDEIDKAGAAVWYLPHHSVVQPKKPDKVRIVFDCKAKYHGTSLNDQVLRGPDLANTLLGVLLRFRQERVALMADVEAMFHQVRVSPDDRDVLRFLWWPGGDLQQDPQTFRMAVHLFGGT